MGAPTWDAVRASDNWCLVWEVGKVESELLRSNVRDFESAVCSDWNILGIFALRRVCSAAESRGSSSWGTTPVFMTHTTTQKCTPILERRAEGGLVDVLPRKQPEKCAIAWQACGLRKIQDLVPELLFAWSNLDLSSLRMERWRRRRAGRLKFFLRDVLGCYWIAGDAVLQGCVDAGALEIGRAHV